MGPRGETGMDGGPGPKVTYRMQLGFHGPFGAPMWFLPQFALLSWESLEGLDPQVPFFWQSEAGLGVGSPGSG